MWLLFWAPSYLCISCSPVTKPAVKLSLWSPIQLDFIMPVQIDCRTSLVAFFPPAIYQSVSSSTILLELLQSLNMDSISTVQFLWNGAVRITFENPLDCDRVVSSGIQFRDIPLCLVSVDAKSCLVYLHDCPAQVPDDVVKRFFSSFGEVHKLSPGLP